MTDATPSTVGGNDATPTMLQHPPGPLTDRINKAMEGLRRDIKTYAKGPFTSDPLVEQVGGDHYKGMAIQPVEYIHANGIGFMEGCAIKYLSRWRAKGGVQDLKKARHFIDMLIQLEQAEG